MATFVMIHGAWHGGWSFDALRPLLADAGHDMIAPDLPGMGGTEDELAAVTLSGWADFTADICGAAKQPVILCGHSRGGIVISETAERVPGKVAALVYICAMLLPSGMSRASWRENATPNPAFQEIQISLSSGLGSIVDTARAPPVFAQMSPPDMVRKAMTRLVAEPSGPRAAVLELGANYDSVPRHYIECLHDLTIPIADQRKMQALQPCRSVTSLEADHSPFLSAPRALADALLTIARGISS